MSKECELKAYGCAMVHLSKWSRHHEESCVVYQYRNGDWRKWTTAICNCKFKQLNFRMTQRQDSTITLKDIALLVEGR